MTAIPNAPIILCVDDDATGLRFRQLILEEKGYNVLLATSAQQGMEVFQSNPVDLVVTDHLMGRALGTDMAAGLKRLRPHVPIIILSGSSTAPAGAENADAYVCKSEGPDALLNRVSALLAFSASQRELSARSRERVQRSRESVLHTVERTQRLMEGLQRRVAGLSVTAAETHTHQLTDLCRERLANIVESVTDAVITVDRTQRIVLFNRAAETIFRCPREQALGKTLDAFIPEHFRASHREHVRELGRTGMTHRPMSCPAVCAGLRADGEEFPFEATLSQVGSGEETLFTMVLRDISERKRAEEEHAQLAAIMESSNDAIIGQTLKGMVTAWNKGAERMLGYTAAEMIGKPASILLPPDRIQEEDQILTRIRRSEKVPLHDSVWLAKDGRVLHVCTSISPIRNARGAVIGGGTIARDLTPVKTAEQATRNAESLKPLSAAPRPWTLPRLLAMSIFGTLVVAAGALLSRWVVEHDPVLNPWLWKWGHPVFMLLLIGSLIYAYLSHINPERKRAEEEHARLAAVVESSSDAIISKSLEGIVLTWNKASERMFGYRADEIVGKPVSILLPPDRIEEENHVLRQIRQGETVPLHDTVRVAKDGRVPRVSLTISPIRDSKGRIIGASTIARDRTQLVMAERALRNSEKLAVAGRMAATVAHEIHGPLEAVANIHFLLERAQLTSATRELVRCAQEEVKRIGQIVKLTLGFHREGEDRRAANVQASDLIDGILTLYRHRIESLGVSIEKRYDSIGAVTAHPGELRQVLSNLIVNASEALAEKGDKLLIHVYESQDWRATGRKGLRIVVADNGSGMPRDIQQKIFEPFFTTKGEKGTGLGLWVTKSLVEKHDGSLRLHSMSGVGTAFSIFLPSNTASGEAA